MPPSLILEIRSSRFQTQLCIARQRCINLSLGRTCVTNVQLLFAGSSLEEILAAVRDQPDSVEAGLVEDDSDETSSEAGSEQDKPTSPDEPLVSLQADKTASVVEESDSSSDANDEDAFEFVRKDIDDNIQVLCRWCHHKKSVKEYHHSQ